MINVNSAAAPFRLLTRRFWLLNVILILLYLWTLSEATVVTVTIQPNTCTAHTPERSLTIPCTGLYRDSVSLYSSSPPARALFNNGLLDWLAPASTWADPNIQGVGADQDALRILARLYRPQHSAGIVLLQTDSQAQTGWAFVVTASERLGVWWHWEDGQLSEPIAGIPFQRPALAQFQSLLRRVLNAHHAALLLMGAAWLLQRFWQRLLTNQNRATVTLPDASAPRHARLLSVLPLLVVFALSLHIAGDVLERIPHVQDSVTYLFQARTLARGQLSAPAPPLPEAFEQEFLLVRDGRWFGKYPPGFPALLALGVLLGAPWLVNPLLATLTVALLFVLARQLYSFSAATARLAILLPLASPFFLFLSGSHMAHSAELFWMTLFMVLWLAALRRHHRSLLALAAGIALGALFLTRQLSAVAAALPFLVITLLSSSRLNWRHLKTTTLRQLLPAGVAALPFLLLLFAHQQALSGDPLLDPRLLFWEYDHLGFGQDIGEGHNAFTLTRLSEGYAQNWYTDASQAPRGHSPARGWHNVQQNWLALEHDLFGWLPAVTFSLIWLVFLLRAPRKEDWALLAIFVPLLATYVFYWADGISFGPRYFFVALPALFLLTARGALLLCDWLGGRSGRLAVASLLLLFVAGAALVNGPRYLQEYRGYNFVSRTNLTLVARQTQKPALVFVEPGTDWWHYGELFSANSPWLDGPIVVARDLSPRANRQLMRHFPDHTAYRLSGSELQRLAPTTPP